LWRGAKYGEGFFESEGYLEIEDHESNAWTPSTAISEVASKQTALAKKRGGRGEGNAVATRGGGGGAASATERGHLAAHHLAAAAAANDRLAPAIASGRGEDTRASRQVFLQENG
jgi:hypothetical protein